MRICFVCLGNICRSPTAEGIMLHLLEQRGIEGYVVDSAGTAAYHVGEQADPRTRATARARGVHLPSLARQFQHGDFERFDYVVAMDQSNAANLRKLARDEVSRQKVVLLREFCARSREAGELDVPDPYYGGAQGFEEVFDICHAACEGLLEHIAREKKP